MIVALIVGYFAAAAFYLWRDLTERSFLRMRPYVLAYRRHRRIGTLIHGCLGWIIGVVANARMRGRLNSYEIGPLAVFAVTASVAYLISN